MLTISVSARPATSKGELGAGGGLGEPDLNFVGSKQSHLPTAHFTSRKVGSACHAGACGASHGFCSIQLACKDFEKASSPQMRVPDPRRSVGLHHPDPPNGAAWS
jgi:hypothetical protein